jgi:hypothetical protein
MTAFDTATIRRITKDWSDLLPGFDIWRPMHLLRRIGPVLQGVCLERSRSGAYYFATSHVHALTRDFPVVSLSLNHRVLRPSGQPEHIDISETELADLATRLAEQTIHSIRESPPSIHEIVAAYHVTAVDRQRKGHAPAVMEMEDSINVAAVAGQAELVEEGFRIATQLAGEWARPRLPLGWTTPEGWLESLRNGAAETSALASTVEGQIVKHRLGKVCGLNQSGVNR